MTSSSPLCSPAAEIFFNLVSDGAEPPSPTPGRESAYPGLAHRSERYETPKHRRSSSQQQRHHHPRLSKISEGSSSSSSSSASPSIRVVLSQPNLRQVLLKNIDSPTRRRRSRSPNKNVRPMSTNLQDYVELLSAEQHVPIDKLRESARNGVSPRVRGEVWMYLLGVLDSDKTSEMTLLKTLRSEYATLPSNVPSELASLFLKAALSHHTRRFESPTYEGLISLTAERSDSPSAALSGGANGPLGPMSGTSLSTISNLNPRLVSNAGGTLTGYATLSLLANQGPRPDYNQLAQLEADSMGNKGNVLVPPPNAPPSRGAYLSIMEEVLGKYWHANGCRPGALALHSGWAGDGEARARWGPGQPPAPAEWVYLATPFVCCLARPVAVFYGFERLMDRLKQFPPLPSRLGSMLGLFRQAIPELHAYFEEEQVPMQGIAISWMTTLLSKEMWLGDVLRLWDSYFAVDDMFTLHCYVCVAILATCKETLEELDGSEAKLMLLDLPPLDVDRLLQDAYNLKISFPLPRPIDDDA